MRIRNKRKLLVRYLIVLLSIVVFMTVMLIPVYLKALKSARLHSTDFLSGTINNGVLHFERSINSAISLNTQMQSTAFSEVKRLDDASFSPENLVKLIQVQQLFSVITRNIDPGHVFYMLFNNNRKVITASESSTNTIYMDNSVFFSTYMVYEALKENVLSLLARLDSSGIGFIPSTSIRINFSAAEDYLTLIVRIPGSSVTICVLYKTSELLSLLGMNILPDAAYLSLKRDNGSEIVSTKAVPRNRDRYTEISFEIPTIHGVLTVGVPESFYIEQVRETKKLVDRYLWGAIVLGLNYGPDRDPLEALKARSTGAISVYAQGDDYHELIKGRLKTLAGKIVARAGGAEALRPRTVGQQRQRAALAHLGRGQHRGRSAVSALVGRVHEQAARPGPQAGHAV